MYFNEKEDTNIDKEFKHSIRYYLNKYKRILIITGIIISALILLMVIIAIRNRNKYYIVLEGLSEMNIYQGTNYNEPGYRAFDSRKNDLTQLVTIKDNLDTNTTGVYTIVYSLKNKSVKRTINVVNRPEMPTTIHLSGEKNIYLKVGDIYIDPGYTAIDIVDGNLTDKVVVTGNVDTSKKGIYRIIYSVINSSNITASETRTVIVE